MYFCLDETRIRSTDYPGFASGYSGPHALKIITLNHCYRIDQVVSTFNIRVYIYTVSRQNTPLKT